MSEELLERIAKTVEEQLKWTKLSGMAQLKAIFEQNFRSNDEKLVYELSDGERSTRDIEKITKVGRNKIAILWKKWYKMNIMEKSTKYEGRRMKRSFSLEDVGMEVPPLPESIDSSQIKPETEFE